MGSAIDGFPDEERNGKSVSVERALSEFQYGRIGPGARATVCVPSFATVASFLQSSNMVAMLPRRLALSAAAHAPLSLLDPPYTSIAIEIETLWVEGTDQDKRQWLLNELAESKDLAPRGHRRMSANPVANGGLLRKALHLPDFRSSAIAVKMPGATLAGNVPTLGNFLRDVMGMNMTSFRVFGPDETQSNRLEAIYEAGKKVWLGEYFPEDADGGQLAPNGRVMEMLSEHTVEGWSAWPLTLSIGCPVSASEAPAYARPCSTSKSLARTTPTSAASIEKTLPTGSGPMRLGIHTRLVKTNNESNNEPTLRCSTSGISY
jgi:D-xylulose 5-phosphate/D-fructose 6-phosphate phosphoketolase